MQSMDITSATAKTRILDVTKAVTALQGQLPVAWGSSVHVAIDEGRPDLFRVLVLPDPETPYAHGAFLFDFMLPKDFPNHPPKVRRLDTVDTSLIESESILADSIEYRQLTRMIDSSYRCTELIVAVARYHGWAIALSSRGRRFENR